jgi:hypothetical protein
MMTFRSAVALSASLLAAILLGPGFALADDAPQGVEPTEPPPTWTPPPPTDVNFAGGEEFVGQQAVPAGQWVFTSQYGWIWMPHGTSFTFVPTTGSTPNMFVFYPAVGWSWVIAPWVWGWGPMPWFGFAGWGAYPWFGTGFGTWYGYARPYAYAGWHGGGYYHGGRWNGVGPGYRPPPGRGGALPPPPRPGARAPGARAGGPVASGAPQRAGTGGPGRSGAMPGAVPGRAGAAPSGAVPGRSGAVPARTYGSVGRQAGLPQNYGTWRGMAQGSRGTAQPSRGYSQPSRGFTSGGSSYAARGSGMTASRGGFGGGGYSGGGGGRSGGSSGGGRR